MVDFKPRPGTFLPYLEYVNKERARKREPASPLTLLEILANRGVPSLPLFELQTQSGLEPMRYGEALRSLRDAGYIAITGDVPEQAVSLTESGRKVASLARPA